MSQGLMRLLWRICSPLLEIRCAACGTPVTREKPAPCAEGKTGGRSVGPALCPACAAVLARRVGGYCPRCGNLTALPRGGIFPCGSCLQIDRPWGRFFFHAAYQGLLREALLRLKHGHELPLADLLGRLLAAHPDMDGDYDVIVPVPLHPARLRERGFNQALELARPLARQFRLPIRPSFLLRGHNTRPQAGLSLEARKRNVRDVFFAPEQVAGYRVLLVDDIATTCSSLCSAALTLRQSGAAAVDVAVVARTPEHAVFSPPAGGGSYRFEDMPQASPGG